MEKNKHTIQTTNPTSKPPFKNQTKTQRASSGPSYPRGPETSRSSGGKPERGRCFAHFVFFFLISSGFGKFWACFLVSSVLNFSCCFTEVDFGGWVVLFFLGPARLQCLFLLFDDFSLNIFFSGWQNPLRSDSCGS